MACSSYKLGIEGKGITEIRDLSIEEHQTYVRASSCLMDFSRDQQLYTIVLLNYDDFLNLLIKYGEQYAKNPSLINWITMEKMVLETNRYLLNYLSSVKTFLDHTETKLQRNYGEQSPRYKSFKEICSKYYDDSFSYRFLIKLRNYSQHCGMPVGDLTLKSEEKPSFSGNICHSFEAKFRKEELLTFKKWGSLKKEILSLPTEFGIIPHIVEMMKCLEKINLALIEDDLPELFKSTEFISQLVSPLEGKVGSPCILQFLEIKRDENGKVRDIKVEITHIPFHIIEIVENIKKEKSLIK
jgi:hypothetical protein